MSQMFESFMQPAAPLRAQPVELDEARDVVEAAPPLLREAHPLNAVRINLQVRVGQSSMTVGELMAARDGEVLVLDRATEQPVDLLLEGSVVARGQLVAVDGSFAVRITELPLPLGLK